MTDVQQQQWSDDAPPQRPSWLAPILTIGVVVALAWAIDRQELLRYSADPARLWPFTFFVTLLALVAMVGLAFLRQTTFQGNPMAPRRRWGYGAVALATIALLFGVLRYAERIALNPISPFEGDMVPLLQSALRVFFEDRQFPYRSHAVATWELPLTFPPALWLPYGVPYLLGVDIRWAGFAGVVLTGVLMLREVWLRVATGGSLPARVGALALPVPLLLVLFGESFTRFQTAMHLGAYWPLVALWAIAIRNRSGFIAGASFAMCGLARPYWIVVAPFYAIYLWRCYRAGERRHALRHIVGALCAGAIIGAPFVLHDPQMFFHGMTAGYGEQLLHHINTDPWRAHGVGFTGLLAKLGAYGARNLVYLALAVPLLAVALWRLRDERSLQLFAVLSIFLFLCFAIIPWFYTFVTPMLLLAFWDPTAARRPLPAVADRSMRLVAFALPLGFVAVVALAPRMAMPSADLRKDTHRWRSTRVDMRGFERSGRIANNRSEPNRLREADGWLAIPIGSVATAGDLRISIRAEGTMPKDVGLQCELNGRVLHGDPSLAAPIPPRLAFAGTNTVRIMLRRNGAPLAAEEVQSLGLLILDVQVLPRER